MVPAESLANVEHTHDESTHTHAYGYSMHSHLSGSRCTWEECRNYPLHDFHTSTTKPPVS